MTDLLTVMETLCLQRRTGSISKEHFRTTLVQLFQNASHDDLANLAADVEHEVVERRT